MRNTSKSKSLAAARRLGDLLTDIGRQRGLRDPILGECAAGSDFTPSQIHALMWLGTDGALTMGELARRSSITEKTITGVVDRLERDGLLQRVRDQADRRVVRVVLTKKGSAAYEDLSGHIQEHLGEFLSLLEPDDREALFRILEKLRDRLARMAAAPGAKEPR